MMKKEIFISFKSIISFILILISIVITIINAVLLYRYNNAIDYKDSPLEAGDYVVCRIEDYLVKPIDKYSPNVYSGQCEVDSTFFKDYYVYNIPYGNDRYVRVKIYNKDMEKKLEEKSTLDDKNISIVGKVISEDNISTEWYEHVSDFSISQIEKGICIKEINYKQYENLILLGGITLIISMFILLCEVKENKKYTVLYF